MKAFATAATFLLAGFVAPSAFAQNSPEATAAAQRIRASRAAASAPAASAPAPSAKMAPAKSSTSGAKAHTTAQKTAAPAPPAAPAGPPPLDAQALAACKNEAGLNFIKRERCVYAHCKGHWGEGDCPPGQDMPTGQSIKEGVTQPFKKTDPGAQGR